MVNNVILQKGRFLKDVLHHLNSKKELFKKQSPKAAKIYVSAHNSEWIQRIFEIIQQKYEKKYSTQEIIKKLQQVPNLPKLTRCMKLVQILCQVKLEISIIVKLFSLKDFEKKKPDKVEILFPFDEIEFLTNMVDDVTKSCGIEVEIVGSENVFPFQHCIILK